MIIVGISGKARMGKTTLAGLLVEKMATKGALVEEVPLATVIKMNVPRMDGETKESWRDRLIAYGTKQRAVFGEDVFVNMLIDRVLGMKLEAVVVPDIRMMNEYRRFADYRFAEFLPVRIEADIPAWKSRFASTEEWDRYQAKNAADPTETELDGLLRSAYWKAVIRNTGSIGYMEGQAIGFLQREGL